MESQGILLAIFHEWISPNTLPCPHNTHTHINTHRGHYMCIFHQANQRAAYAVHVILHINSLRPLYYLRKIGDITSNPRKKKKKKLNLFCKSSWRGHWREAALSLIWIGSSAFSPSLHIPLIKERHISRIETSLGLPTLLISPTLISHLSCLHHNHLSFSHAPSLASGLTCPSTNYSLNFILHQIKRSPALMM